jgi:signal transduction histidine kinase
VISVDRLRAALRAHPLAADTALALVVLILTLVVPRPDAPSQLAPPTAALVVAGLATLALAFRRRWPLVTLALVLAGMAAAAILAGGQLAPLAPGIALYTVAVRTDRRTTVLTWGASALILIGATELASSDSTSILPPIISTLAAAGVFSAVGDAVRNRRAYIAAVEERAVRAEQTREEEARRRVVEDRLRIARELHDVIAHHIAVVSVQAGVARHLLSKDPHAAHEALEHVQQASAAILDELSGVLSVLRHPGDSVDGLAPAPGLDQLEELVASYAAAGLEVSWSLTGRPQTLADTADLVAYRVLEEALTNALKHGTGVAQLAVRYTAGYVELEVTNPVREAQPARNGRADGYGLMGMTERASAVGGAIRVGPVTQGRFRVTATLPVHTGQSE